MRSSRDSVRRKRLLEALPEHEARRTGRASAEKHDLLADALADLFGIDLQQAGRSVVGDVTVRGRGRHREGRRLARHEGRRLIRNGARGSGFGAPPVTMPTAPAFASNNGFGGGWRRRGRRDRGRGECRRGVIHGCGGPAHAVSHLFTASVTAGADLKGSI